MNYNSPDNSISINLGLLAACNGEFILALGTFVSTAPLNIYYKGF